jgi:hypothetical protein
MKRRWFQIHLSTSITLSFVVAVFLYLNTDYQPKRYQHGNGVNPEELVFQRISYGWPWVFHHDWQSKGSEFIATHRAEIINDYSVQPPIDTLSTIKFRSSSLAADVALCLVCASVTVVLSEVLVRREVRKT